MFILKIFKGFLKLHIAFKIISFILVVALAIGATTWFISKIRETDFYQNHENEFNAVEQKGAELAEKAADKGKNALETAIDYAREKGKEAIDSASDALKEQLSDSTEETEKTQETD